MVSEIGEFKGHAIITLKKDEDDERGFVFGKTKAKLILENLDAIKEFVGDEQWYVLVVKEGSWKKSVK